ncbi:hypothetical protein [Shimia sp. SDUM112013]|uniref:hypothetical protein n=1 Tax=Shimia sp. SDUM112013 TaxID=3136160 RepID=UPI0032EB2255
MFALIRLGIVAFIVLTILYVVISVWSRRTRRGKLEAEWDEEGMTGDRDLWIEEGLRDYDESLRRKLILGVYVIPILCVIAIIYVINIQ